jgi:hypothetical protein
MVVILFVIFLSTMCIVIISLVILRVKARLSGGALLS